MSCCWGLPPPAGEALAGVEAEGTGFSGIVLPPVEDGGIRGMPKEPRLQRKAGCAQRQAGTSGCPLRAGQHSNQQALPGWPSLRPILQDSFVN